MCGIAGFVSPERVLNQNHLDQFCDDLSHRGPDARGVWLSEDGRAGLAHTRLSIIDPVGESNQPMQRGHLYISYNGEIYNYLELRAELETYGHTFQTNSDTEVLLIAYMHWGEDCLQRLNGMYALAIWDEKEKEMFIARDRIGQKPLYYRTLKDGSFIFASEPYVLAKIETHTAIDTQEMHAFLALGYMAGNETLYKGVRSLQPAHCMRVKLDGTYTLKEYWSPIPAFENPRDISEQDAIENIQYLIDDAVKIRMRADVPYGVFLSAGIDSNTVLASMKRQRDDIKTFSIGFDDINYDESQTAARSAEYFGTNHHRFTVANDALSLDKALNDMALEPLADASYMPMAVLSGETRKHVKMVLTGDGGDELFAGYPTYVASMMHRKLSRFMPFSVPLPIPKKRRSPYFKFYQFLNGLPLDTARAHFSWRVLGSQKLWAQTLSNTIDWDLVYQKFYKHFQKVGHLSPLNQMLYTDIKTFLPGSVLAKADRATMRYGLEARSPLLDYGVIEFAASLPDHLKLKFANLRFEGKYVLRQSQRGRLPEFLYKQPKRGFSMPISQHLKDTLYDVAYSTLKAPHMQSYFDQTHCLKLLSEHKAGKADHGLMLMNMVIASKCIANHT